MARANVSGTLGRPAPFVMGRARRGGQGLQPLLTSQERSHSCLEACRGLISSPQLALKVTLIRWRLAAAPPGTWPACALARGHAARSCARTAGGRRRRTGSSRQSSGGLKYHSCSSHYLSRAPQFHAIAPGGKAWARPWCSCTYLRRRLRVGQLTRGPPPRAPRSPQPQRRRCASAPSRRWTPWREISSCWARC